MKILLDMDEVLVDFVGGICRALGKESPYPEASGWNMSRYMDLSDKEFWEPAHYAHFWADLEWTTDGRHILDMASRAVGEDSVFLLTSPCKSPASYSGKAMWVERELPQFMPRLMVGSCKHLCARAGQVLVDDANHNIDAFREAGGTAIMVPRPWNRRRGLDTLTTLSKEIPEATS